MSKPQLVVTAKNMSQLQGVIRAGADAVYIGNEQYSLRVGGSFSYEDIQQAVHFAHDHGAKVLVAVNALLHNDDLKQLPNHLQQLEKMNVDAIVFSDPSVLMVVQELKSSLTLYWNNETTSTNADTARFWGERGAKRAILARELALEEVIDIKKQLNETMPQMGVEVQVHGMTCIFHSFRGLVSNYYDHVGCEDMDTSPDAQLYLQQHEKDTHYPIYEDKHGTHIMSNEDICMVEHLSPLIEAGIDAFKIDGLMKSDDYVEEVVKIYREAINQCIENPNIYEQKASLWKNKLLQIQPSERRLGTGFYFKQQIY